MVGRGVAVVSEEVLAGPAVPGGGGGGRQYLTLHCHHQNDSCIKMGCDESHFKDYLIVRGKATKTMSLNYNF